MLRWRASGGLEVAPRRASLIAGVAHSSARGQRPRLFSETGQYFSDGVRDREEETMVISSLLTPENGCGGGWGGGGGGISQTS